MRIFSIQSVPSGEIQYRVPPKCRVLLTSIRALTPNVKGVIRVDGSLVAVVDPGAPMDLRYMVEPNGSIVAKNCEVECALLEVERGQPVELPSVLHPAVAVVIGFAFTYLSLSIASGLMFH